MKCCGRRRAIPMALRPPLSIKRAGASKFLCIIARARSAEAPRRHLGGTSVGWPPVEFGLQRTPAQSLLLVNTVTAKRKETTARLNVPSELKLSYERKAKILKCGCLVAVAGVSATLGSWASGAFSKSASDVHVQPSAALEANGFEEMHSKRFLPWEWLDPEPEPPAPSPSCEPDLTSNVCYGYYYYRLVSASDIGEDPTSTRIPWTSFFTATIPGGPLENCVLAPVTSARDLNEIFAASGQEKYSWVGIKKSVQSVVNDNDGNGSRNNWYNLDGTSVPTNTNYWVSGQPDNRVGLQTYGAVDTELEGLDDVENYRPPDINPDIHRGSALDGALRSDEVENPKTPRGNPLEVAARESRPAAAAGRGAVHPDPAQSPVGGIWSPGRASSSSSPPRRPPDEGEPLQPPPVPSPGRPADLVVADPVRAAPVHGRALREVPPEVPRV
ncbi:hypothetical protein THAOC_24884, partial [Thalassiosira oceanica]